MGDADWLRGLAAQDPDEVLETLAEIGAERQRTPSQEVVRECVHLFAHDDADVRHDAIAAIAIHWGHRDSCGPLVSLVARELDEYVLEAAARALGRVVRDNPDLRPTAGAALARLALEEGHSLNVRKLAYVEARSLFDRADASARIAVAFEPSATELDLAWLRHLAESGQETAG